VVQDEAKIGLETISSLRIAQYWSRGAHTIAAPCQSLNFMKQQSKPASPWSPFQQAVFRNLWIATVASNVGTWMQSVGAA
jgi:hypothetical protein